MANLKIIGPKNFANFDRVCKRTIITMSVVDKWFNLFSRRKFIRVKWFGNIEGDYVCVVFSCNAFIISTKLLESCKEHHDYQISTGHRGNFKTNNQSGSTPLSSSYLNLSTPPPNLLFKAGPSSLSYQQALMGCNTVADKNKITNQLLRSLGYDKEDKII